MGKTVRNLKLTKIRALISSAAQKCMTMKVCPSVIMIIPVVVLFYILAPAFAHPINISILLAVVPELGILALGVTILMIAGEFDLSVGSIFGLAPVVNVILIRIGINPWLAIFVTCILCMIIGISNGLLTIKLRIPSFVTTLGAMMIWRGVVLILTRGGFPPPFPAASIPVANILAGEIGRIDLFRFHISLIWFGLLALALWIVLERTRFGNGIFGIGGKITVARSLGINTFKVKLTAFMLVSLLAGLSGLVQAHRLRAVLPAAGVGMELEAIAASVIGGTALAGGIGGISGSVVGAFLIRIIPNGLVLVGVPGYWFRVFIGVILVIAVIFNQFIRRKTRAMR